ncbi:methyltransferase [Antrihabitans stalagmiti]|uniref:methyltransferase n=1 Tax=Antrihabitans stalagmiti TaxID=2799499 RepID=UPI0027DB0516|nr:methyltransferase domain-containing protein [Antrihabitans stalagmiti]
MIAVATGGIQEKRLSSSEEKVQAAVAPYTKAFLRVYDLWVVRLSNRYAWRCDAEKMLALYNTHLGERHLEVGPGTGWYLDHATFPTSRPAITLLDLSASTLEFTAARLPSAVVAPVVGSVLDPVPEAAGAAFDSIGINYVMHCVPGSFDEKGVAFQNLARVLRDDGVLFGSTILASGEGRRTLFGRALMGAYSRIGAFNCRLDDREGLERALKAAFAQVQITMEGDVALFAAHAPHR